MDESDSAQEDEGFYHPSWFSEYSADGGKGNYDITGSVQLKLWWNKGSLYIQIIRAKKLANIEGDQPPSPYIKTYLIPDYSKLTKRKTEVKNKTTRPIYNKVIKYQIPMENIGQKILWLSVWNSEKYGRNLFLGEISLCLASLDLMTPQEKWYMLEDRTVDRDLPMKGELKFSLNYQPDDGGCLFIYVYRLNHLIQSSQYTNYFVRAVLFPDELVQRTKCIQYVEDPVWKKELKYSNITCDGLRDLQELALELSLWNFDENECNDFIGCVCLGPKPDKECKTAWMDSNDLESSLWSAMLSHPGQWIRTTMELRPNIASYANTKENSSTEEDITSKKTRLSFSNQAAAYQSDAFIGDYSISGRMLVKLEHNKERLLVNILRADNLAHAGYNNDSNPYIKVYLFYNNCQWNKWISRVKRNTVNPFFNEVIRFPANEYQLPRIKLKIGLLHYEEYHWDQVLGWVDLDLSKFNFWGDLCWYNLNEEDTEDFVTHSIPANITLSLKYEEKDMYKGHIDGDMDIFINKINGIPYDNEKEGFYCFVIVNVLPGIGSVNSKKVILTDGNPIISHTLKFKKIRFDHLFYQIYVKLKVVIQNKSRRTVIGGVHLGHSQLVGHIQEYMDCNVLESTHWEHMLAHGGEWVNCTHTLRPDMEYSKASKSSIPNFHCLKYKADDVSGKLIVSAKFEPMSKKLLFKGNLFLKIRAEKLKCKTSDGIYATCTIYPHLESEHWKNSPTETIKGTTNPTWKELFIFENMFEDDLFSRHVLNVKVIDSNGQLPFIYVGRVCLGLHPENSTAEEILHWQAIFRNPGEWVEDIHALRY